ncbi:MAG: lectin [Lysobacter sp.]
MNSAPPIRTVGGLLLTLLLTGLLAACGVDGDAGPAATSSTAATAEPGQDQYSDQPDEDVPPATAPAGSLPPVDEPDDQPDPLPGDAHFDGYGQAVFGMDADQVRSVWVGELIGNSAEGEACFHLAPAGQPDRAYFALMFEGGKFVRYSVSSDELVAPGGAQRGMDIAQIEQLYPGRVKLGPHKYVEGGHYLRIADDRGSDGVLVLETDAGGTVTEWRVGVPLQVDYVEGCS